MITGAASGLGLALAEALAAEGAGVVIAGLDEAKGKAAALKIVAAGQTAIFCRADISQREMRERSLTLRLDSSHASIFSSITRACSMSALSWSFQRTNGIS